jgi:uncharacterized membrane protein YgaE (UPF0421/DUF939 family)
MFIPPLQYAYTLAKRKKITTGDKMTVTYRALRSGVTVMVCLAVAYFLKLNNPFFVALPVFTTISDTLTESYLLGRSRLLGSLVGAAIGLLCALIRPGDIFLSGFGIILIIFSCHYLKWENATGFGVIIFLSIMVVIKGQNTFLYSLSRLYQTVIGIIIVLLINGLIFRINEYNIIIRTCKHLFEELTLIMKHHENIQQSKMNEIEEKLTRMKKSFSYYKKERLFHRKKEQVNELGIVIDLLDSMFEHLKMLSVLNFSWRLSDENQTTYNSLFESHQKNIDINITGDEMAVANFHFQKVLEAYKKMAESGIIS